MEADRLREKELVESEPLVPHRFYNPGKISWYNKRKGQPSYIHIEKTDWHIHFFSSAPGSSPPQGSSINLGFFDEEILDDIWYDEIAARLLDTKGQFIWSASPELYTLKYHELYQRARKELVKEKSQRRVSYFEISLLNNPHLDKEAIDVFQEKLAGSHRAEAKIHGRFMLDKTRVYPEFDEERFKIEPFEIPEDWCCYMAVDPSWKVTAAVLFAVPPPEHELGQHKIVYDEIYLENAIAIDFAETVKEKIDNREFQEFVIDRNMFLQTMVGSGESVGSQYVTAFEHFGIASAVNGCGFSFVIRDEKAGRNYVHKMMKEAPDGRPILLFMDGKVPNLVREIRGYQLKRQGNEYLDQPVKKRDDCADALRYGCSNGLEYVPPKMPVSVNSIDRLMRLFDAQEKSGAAISFGPKT